MVHHLPGQQAGSTRRRRRPAGLARIRNGGDARRLDAARSRDHAGAGRARPQQRAGLRGVRPYRWCYDTAGDSHDAVGDRCPEGSEPMTAKTTLRWMGLLAGPVLAASLYAAPKPGALAPDFTLTDI